MKWIKNSKWTKWNDLKYCFVMPPMVLYHIIDWCYYKETREEFGLRELIDLAQGIADMKCGRLYKWEED